MKCNTGEEMFFDVGSLYAKFKELKNLRKPKGLRYRLETILMVIVLAKLCDLVLSLLIGKLKFCYLLSARRYFTAFPALALALLT